METALLDKQQLMENAQQSMQKLFQDEGYTDQQKLALTCRILFDHGHDAGLAGHFRRYGRYLEGRGDGAGRYHRVGGDTRRPGRAD